MPFRRRNINPNHGKELTCVICSGTFVLQTTDEHTRETCYNETCTKTLISRRSKERLPFGKNSTRCQRCGRLRKDCGHDPV